jgi:uncharacterized protein
MMLRPPFLAVLCLLVSGLTAAAQELPAPTDSHVLDLAEVLDATAEARIDRLLADTEASTGVEMEVVTMTDIASHGGAGERLEAYAASLLQTWEIGSPEKNDGILILVTTEPAEARVALGSGYAPVYDKRAARVLGTAVLPAFRDGRIPEGIEAGVISAREQLITPFLAGAPVTATEGFETAAPEPPTFLPYILLAGAILGTVAYFALRKARANKTCPSCGDVTLNRTFEVIDPPTGDSEGSGIEHRLCRSCGYTDREFYLLTPSMGGGYRRTLRK